MKKLDIIYVNLKVVSHSVLFEVKLQKKKFIIFSIVTIIFFYLMSIVPYYHTDRLYLPPNPNAFPKSLLIIPWIELGVDEWIKKFNPTELHHKGTYAIPCSMKNFASSNFTRFSF